MALIDKLTAIADAVREKTEKTESFTLDQIVQEISDLGVILVDASIGIPNRTASGEIRVYTSERLKNLTNYIVLFYEAIPDTKFRTVANLGLKTGNKIYDRIKIAYNINGSFFGIGSSGTPMINNAGDVVVEPYATDYAIQVNTYRLIVIGE